MDAAAAARLEGPWVAVVGENRPFPFLGEYRDNGSTNAYQMLYPAPNMAAFIAGVATHAALQSAANDARATAQSRQSDRVLAPYVNAIGKLDTHGVFHEALRMRQSQAEISMSADATSASSLQVHLAAHAIMAQSQRALIVDLVARIDQMAGQDDEFAFVHKVRVISDPILAEDDAVSMYWLENDGHRLKTTTENLLAKAIDLFVADATRHLAPSTLSQISARYRFGNEQRTERADLLAEPCGRQILRTLRGWVLSVPVWQLPEKRACQAPVQSNLPYLPPA
ncbi:hypothetical protein [Denitromonas iodatirespirans]|uniref:Uncharacterized protein n=1 Tax=Denitromonas iodatirespirans TaxID=2795389 RepID=A0A944D788_DENI1|nr:hypothetical protein [Denitromonas iodatirespirans]MBT0959802.1 hypothetical protein [Denitromonas iodatirespirans]